jgi:hypothetical protein
MKTCELFAGCSITIMPHHDLWLVALSRNTRETVCMRTDRELPDALDLVHEWTLLLTDETDVRVDQDARREAEALLRETVARLAIGADIHPPMKQLDRLIERDKLRRWFEREMGS